MELIDLFKEEKNNAIVNLTEVYRHASRPKIKQENLPEHQYFTAISVMEIISWYKSLGINIPSDLELQAIRSALIHDLPELYTNDVLHPAKNKYPELKQILDKAEQTFLKEEFPCFYNDYMELLKSEKNEDLLGLIVKLADIASLLRWTARELDLGNKNAYVEEVYENSKLRFRMFQDMLEEKLKCLK